MKALYILSLAVSTHTNRHDKDIIRTYKGPVLSCEPEDVVAGIELGELGLDLIVAPSTIAPGSLGLFVALSEGVESTTVPAKSLICGYSREGTFLDRDEGDKTVAFGLPSKSTAVFYDRQLMTIMDALELAARTVGANKACGLAGHELIYDDTTDHDKNYHTDDNESSGTERNVDLKINKYSFFVPAFLNRQNTDNNTEKEEADSSITVANMGQFCNDLAWSFDNPPSNKDEYDASSLQQNCVELAWRLEFDKDSNCLVPSWPVSILANDFIFENDEFMELGTKYGWNYWQATVDIENVN